MTAPIEGQDAILRNGTEAGEEPLLDTLASLARTALTDPDGLPNGSLDFEDEPSLPASRRLDALARAYAVDQLDAIIEMLNPSTETRENVAGSVRALGRQLAERASAIRAIDAEEPDREAYLEAATDLDNALDLIDSALVALEGSP